MMNDVGPVESVRNGRRSSATAPAAAGDPGHGIQRSSTDDANNDGGGGGRLDDALTELWSALFLFFDERGVASAVPDFQRDLYRKRRPLLIDFELEFVKGLAASFDANAQFFEIGSGIGILPLAIAGAGLQAIGVEADLPRHRIALDIQAFLKQSGHPAADRVTFINRKLPLEREPFLEQAIPIISNIVVQPKYIAYPGWFDFLSRYSMAIVNLGRFIERRTSPEEQLQLIDQFDNVGLTLKETVYEDESGSSRYVLLVNPEIIVCRERLDVAIAGEDVGSLIELLDAATPKQEELIWRRLTESQNTTLRNQLRRQYSRRRQPAEAVAVPLPTGSAAPKRPVGGSAVEALAEAFRAVIAEVAGNGSALSRGSEAALPPARRFPIDMVDRYGALYPDASRKIGPGHDVIWLGVIDWHFRIQRPQHLASYLAETGSRVFYVSIVFEAADERGRFDILSNPHLGVFEVRLRLDCELPSSFYQGFSEAQIREIQAALDELIDALHLETPVIVLNHPNWQPAACGIAGATVVYDCLDFTTGFSNIPASVGELEAALVSTADLVIAASQPLADHIAKTRPCVIVRNAAEIDFFGQAFSEGESGERPVIGYFGAISSWYEIDWIVDCARSRPQWEFRLIGSTVGCDIEKAKQLPNVRFLGERPYDELPEHLREFDVAVIPFKLIELIKCTNPVKLYEYMAAGKPVVASRMPEVVQATDMVYLADDAATFEQRIAQALAEDNLDRRRARQAWARQHDWSSRAVQIKEAIDATFPLVSVVVLTYNNWAFTEACLYSLRRWSEYPNLEVIVVDNLSTDETRRKLRELEPQDPRLRVILNDNNSGFAAGNNIGLRAARGEFVIILNNDTFVTRGWIRDLIRPMLLDPRIGLVGPLTNNIGNEQKIKVSYSNMQEMYEISRRFVRTRSRRIYPVKGLAFFCIALRRAMVEEVGLLDESYGLGFFEDDDYCKRVEESKYKIVIADDVFIHHHLSASYNALGSGKRAELLEHNRKIFEAHWGPWQPHRYRDEPGFG